jgi:hypothetical protein
MDKDISTKQFPFFHHVVFAVIVKSALETGRNNYPSIKYEG